MHERWEKELQRADREVEEARWIARRFYQLILERIEAEGEGQDPDVAAAVAFIERVCPWIKEKEGAEEPEEGSPSALESMERTVR